VSRAAGRTADPDDRIDDVPPPGAEALGRRRHGEGGHDAVALDQRRRHAREALPELLVLDRVPAHANARQLTVEGGPRR
jgi:hypothetical protein